MSEVSEGAGLLVLGMHRSGTSALSRLLSLAGADVGTRVLGASAGNEGGHWEDAFAVELHERLLDSFGARWDDPFPLPAGWMQYDVALQARDLLRAYLAGDRAAHGIWSAKDPRLSLFAELWLAAAADIGMPVASLVMLRHPLEVADSLAVRDGIGRGQALLLWIDHTLSALHAAEQGRSLILDYDMLLRDWRLVGERITRLHPGLDFEAAAQAIEGTLTPVLRHHARQDAEGLPPPLANAWHALQALAVRGELPHGTAAAMRATIGDLRSLVAPYERIGRAESAAGAMADMPQQMDELRARMDVQHAGVIDAISSELRHMQVQAAAASAELASLHRERDATHALFQSTQLALDSASAELASTQAALEMAAAQLTSTQVALDAANIRLAEVEQARDATAAKLRESTELIGRVLASRSWKLTRPLRALRRLLRTHKGEARDLVQGRDTAPVEPARVEALGLAPAPPLANRPDVFVWAVIDWNFRTQRPQHLARALSEAGHRVFYISNNFVDAPEPGFSVLPLDASGRLFQIHLHLQGAPQIYAGMPDTAQFAALQGSLAAVLAWGNCDTVVSLVQHPYWTRLATMVPNPRVVYDCMDHHSGFANNGSTVLEAEARLVDMADLVIVTSESLAQDMHGRARALALVRNATEYEHFAQRPSKVFADAEGRRILGYYGAIAEWFDPALVRAVAKRHPEVLVLLIGADTAGVGEALADLPNIRFMGEVRYAELPYWLHAFDVCLLPFKVEPLTLATNPVKVYEYLSAGKAVVAVDLPEMRQFDGLVRTATSVAGFADAVDEALAEAPGAHRAERQGFAATQTWGHRASMLQEVVTGLDEPRVSVVVLTYNNLDLTRRCLESIERYSDYPALEVIVVDNASQDGSVDWLRDWSTHTSPAGHVRRLILNDRNAGFAAGNNVGLRAATGDILVILNNDTQVTRGWIRTLRSHFRRDHALGLIGPVTDNIGNEARVQVSWSDDADMHVQAGRYTRARPGGELRMHTAAFFCVAMPRAVYEAVGDLDESFGLGFFEDDDYCRRVEAAGYRIACAEDVFVHHHLSASFNKLGDDERGALFQRNRERYEAKWGAWVPHTYRDAEKAS